MPGPGDYSAEHHTIKQRSDEAAALIQSSFRAHTNRRKSRGLFADERRRAEAVSTHEQSSAAQIQPRSDFGKRADEIRGHFALGASGKRFDVPGSIYFGCAPTPVPAQMWRGRAQSRCRCGRGGGVSPVPVQMWEGWERFNAP